MRAMLRYRWLLTLCVVSFPVGQLSAERVDDAAAVVVYGHVGCPWTRRSINWLEQQGVEYQLRDVKNDADANREFYRLGYKKIPQIIVAQQDEITGWRRGKLEKTLRKHKLLSAD